MVSKTTLKKNVHTVKRPSGKSAGGHEKFQSTRELSARVNPRDFFDNEPAQRSSNLLPVSIPFNL